MANTLQTPSVLAREMTMVLKNEDVFYQLMRNPAHEARFTGNEKVGETIKVVVPGAANVREFTGSATSRDITESTVDVTIDKKLYDQVTVGQDQWTLSLDRFSERVLQPIARGFADELASHLAAKALLVPHFVGTPADPPDSKADITALNRIMATNKAPKRGRVCVVDEYAEADILSVDGFSDAEKRGDQGTALREASIGRVYGIDWSMDQSVYKHTAGTLSGDSTLVNGAVAAGATSLDLDGGTTTNTIKKGDIFTVADVDGTYVFTADATATAGAVTGATFTPAAPTGGFPDNKAIDIRADHTKNLAWSPGAFTAVAFPPNAPQGAANASTFFDPDLGLGMSVVFDYNSTSLSDVITFQLYVGGALLQADLAALILG